MDSLFATHREKVSTEDFVMMQIAKTELYSTGSMYRPATPQKRDLGSAILLAAIEDYRSLDEEMHDLAEQFLFPQTADRQNHFEWVVSLAEGLNPGWLREALDRAKSEWDEQRRR